MLGIDDLGLAVDQVEDAASGGEGGGQLASRVRERLDRLERRQGQQRQQRHEDAVELAREVRGGGDREHARDRRAGDEQP